MKVKYLIELYNKDQNLELTKKKKEILNALREILSQKIGLTKCEILNIDVHSMTIEVSEITDRWHGIFGNLLANEYNMRRYCDEKNKSRMFNFNIIN